MLVTTYGGPKTFGCLAMVVVCALLSACSQGGSTPTSAPQAAGPSSSSWSNGYQPTTTANVAGNSLEFVGVSVDADTAASGTVTLGIAATDDLLPTAALANSYSISTDKWTLAPSGVTALTEPGTIAALNGASVEQWSTTSSDNEESISIWTPTGATNSYSSLVSWVMDDDKDLSTPVNGTKIGAVGQRTGSADMPTTGTARFTGQTFGTFANSVSNGYSFNGDVGLDVNFASGSVSGTLTNISVYDTSSGVAANSMLTGGTLAGRINGNRITGSGATGGASFTGGIASQLGSSAVVTHSAGFFGPPDELEIGGGFSALNPINNAVISGGYLTD